MPITFQNINNGGGISILNVSGGRIQMNVNPSAIPPAGVYSNFEQYIINGIRQATTSSIIRSNVSTSRRLVVINPITVTGFRFIRIPPDNWTSTVGYNITPTLSIVSGTGATIDGGTSNKTFTNQSVVYNPPTNRTGAITEYDIYTMRPSNLSTTTLTVGEYTINLIGGVGTANMNIAVLTNSLFPIDTSGNIYPSTTAAITHFVMQVF
jgi:hypothetical protein